MKKVYLLVSFAIVAIAFSMFSVMAADVVQGQSPAPLADHPGAVALSAQAFRHRQWVWTPGMVAEPDFIHDSAWLNLADTGVMKNFYNLDMKASANDVEVSVPVTFAGTKRVKKVTVCSWGESNTARIDSLDVYNGHIYLATASGAGKYFDGYNENTFDLGAYYAVDRGLTVVLHIDNGLAADQWFIIESVGAETRW